MKQILYATSITYPAPYANREQTVRTACALADFFGRGRVTLGGRNIRLGANTNLAVKNFSGSARSFFLAARYMSYIKKERVDVVYAREIKLLFFMVLYDTLAYRSHTRFFFEAHEVLNPPPRYYRYMLARVVGIVVISDGVRSAIQRLTSCNNFALARDAVSKRFFEVCVSMEEARTRLNLPAEVPLALYVGSFFRYAWKGVDVVLESMRYVPEEVHFALVGGTDEEMRAIRRQYPDETKKRLVVRPFVDNAEIPVYLSAATMLLLPNKRGTAISERYTSPMKLFEYMASGKPIVASDLPSVREVLDAKNSVLCAPNDPRALARAIMEVVADPSRAAALAASSKRDASRYTWEKRAEIIGKFIADTTDTTSYETTI